VKPSADFIGLGITGGYGKYRRSKTVADSVRRPAIGIDEVAAGSFPADKKLPQWKTFQKWAGQKSQGRVTA